ncbi:MAG: hypothetical protein [Bacteriophage sp.]|nr:MAG: hypothetical protein [Bacteriophage sp.]
MKLNCKPGDLAIHINACNPENIGAIVHVIEYAGFNNGSHEWWTEGNGPGDISCDEHLRPIRDQDGEDETLTWAGKPEEVTA